MQMTSRFAWFVALAGTLAACSAGAPAKTQEGTGGHLSVGGATGSGAGPSSGGGLMLGMSGAPPDGGGDNPCKTTLNVTYRDFNEMHPDFERAFAGDVPRRGLVASTLGPDAKPVYQDNVGCPALLSSPTACDNWTPTGAVIESAATFAQWYNTVDSVNIELPKTLALTETPPGSGVYGYSSTAFFPLGPTEGFGITPKNNDQMENFLFTTEVHVLFGYVSGQTFAFSGDDDLWIFVNGKLALDLGSMHAEADGTIDFDAQATALGIVPGNTYPMDIFHAERHTRASDFKVTTNIACFTPAGPK
jgi:fibro-slime domain-containing protein